MAVMVFLIIIRDSNSKEKSNDTSCTGGKQSFDWQRKGQVAYHIVKQRIVYAKCISDSNKKKPLAVKTNRKLQFLKRGPVNPLRANIEHLLHQTAGDGSRCRRVAAAVASCSQRGAGKIFAMVAPNEHIHSKIVMQIFDCILKLMDKDRSGGKPESAKERDGRGTGGHQTCVSP